MSVPVLEARGVGRTLPGVQPVTLVRDIDVAVGGGELVAITGPSGSGKSSLLYLLGLLDQPTAGEVLLDGRPTAGLGDAALAALRLERLGFVFQFHFLLPEFTALGNVMLPMRRLGRLDHDAMRERASKLLHDLDLKGQERKRPDQLSGGQRQRVAIARALANDPQVILADEPTGNLDTRNSEAVFAVFTRLVGEQGRTVIMVTHEEELAVRAGRRLHLVDGRIVRDEVRTGAQVAMPAP